MPKKKEKMELYGRLGGKPVWGTKDAEAGRLNFLKQGSKEMPNILRVHKAWMVMLVKQGVVSLEDGRKILRVLNRDERRIITEMAETFDPAFNRPILQTERYLTDHVGAIAGDVNIGRTLPPPFYRLDMRERILSLIKGTLAFRELLLKVAHRHRHTVMPGYTHVQHAQPTTFGHYLMSLYDAIDRASVQVEQAYASTNLLDLGCGALAGTSFKIDRNLPAKLLGFDALIENSNDAVASTDQAVDVVCALTNLTVPAGRVANELDVWHSFEYGMVELPDEICAPSSMMPQKKNPALFEFQRQTTAHVMACYTDVVGMSHGIPYGDVCDVKWISLRTCDAMNMVRNQLATLGRALDSLTVHKETCLRHAANGFSTVTELAALLHREANVPLRPSHAVVAEVVRNMIEKDKKPADITPAIIDAAAVKLLGKPVGLDEKTIAAALDPVKFVEAHDSQGGVAPKEVARMIRARKRSLASAERRHDTRLKRLEDADKHLDAAVKEILKAKTRKMGRLKRSA